MKANELMIGDWVMFPHGIDRIVDLPYIEGRGLCASFAASATLFPVSIEQLKSIPITPEILEKNFEKKTFYGIYDDYFDLDISEYSDGLYIVTYHSCEFNTPDQTIHVSWVHELQHFFIICGIEKEIFI